MLLNPFNIPGAYSYGDTDLRHRFVFSPVYNTGKCNCDNTFACALLSGYTLSSIIQFQSGDAFSQTVGVDLTRDGNARNDRVPGTQRNAFHTPATYQFDAGTEKAFAPGEKAKLRLILEGFNIFNHSNILTVNANVFSSITFMGTPASGITLNRPPASERSACRALSARRVKCNWQ